METKPPVPRTILVGIQIPGVDDVAHAASMEELGLLVRTLGYEVVGSGDRSARVTVTLCDSASQFLSWRRCGEFRERIRP